MPPADQPALACVNAGQRSRLAVFQSNATVTPLIAARPGCARRFRTLEHQPRANSPVAGTRPTAPTEGRHTLSRGLSFQAPRIAGVPRLFPAAADLSAPSKVSGLGTLNTIGRGSRFIASGQS